MDSDYFNYNNNLKEEVMQNYKGILYTVSLFCKNMLHLSHNTQLNHSSEMHRHIKIYQSVAGLATAGDNTR